MTAFLALRYRQLHLKPTIVEITSCRYRPPGYLQGEKTKAETNMREFVLTGMAITFATATLADQAVSVEPILRSGETIAHQPILLPQGPVEVTASIFTIQPGAALPVHRHAFPRYGYVLSGQLSVSNLETGKTQTFHAGDVIIESVSKWHSGTNPGSEPLKLLVIDQAPLGAQTTEVKQ